jgi:two-component system nitrate/nitrite response regulator NarL
MLLRGAISVVVADAQPMFRDGLVRAIRQDSGFQLVGEAEDGRAALAAVEARRPHVLLVDRDLPGLSGLRVLRAIRRDELETRVVLVTNAVDGADAYEALRCGASGLLSRLCGVDEVRAAVRRAADGGVTLCEQAVASVARELRLRDPEGRPPLSAREREVLGHVADGLSAPAIARRLGVAPRTVRTHLEHLYDKLGAGDRAQLVALAMRRGLLE